MLRTYKIVLFVFLLSACTVWGQPQSGSWEIAGNMPVSIAGASVVVVDSSIYVLGGYSDSLQDVVDWIFRFNPRSNTWGLAGHMNAKRANFIADKIGSKIYSLGGEANSRMHSNGPLEVFDCNTGNSTIIDTNLKFLRMSPTGLINDSVLYIVGGASFLNPDMNPYLLEYNINTKTISFSVQGTPGMREEQMSVLFNNSIYLFGGLLNTVTPDIFNYNLLNHQLHPLHQGLLKPRSGGKAVLIPHTNQVLIMGGYDQNAHALSTVETYQIMDSMHVMGHNLPQMHARRTNFMAVYFDSTVYVFGGQDDLKIPVKSIERFSFITGINDRQSYTPSEFTIDQNYPNPFNPTTTIGYNVSQNSAISIKVYDLLGKEVAVLVNENKSPGYYTVPFNGNNLSSGVYFYRISAVPLTGNNNKEYIETRKMILLK